ncbi:hypothetical protein CBOM_03504 [Ceraceosorus bombacis]|uniref:Uncharacterized protein n=1 Tax=Ceraceosorus bombacis TaxID=401625 RepID=A0A0N7L9Z6_9BASI|nr:hypothetical protein CBOM_03504 [Ceraceosorus bombacis]
MDVMKKSQEKMSFATPVLWQTPLTDAFLPSTSSMRDVDRKLKMALPSKAEKADEKLRGHVYMTFYQYVCQKMGIKDGPWLTVPACNADWPCHLQGGADQEPCDMLCFDLSKSATHKYNQEHLKECLDDLRANGEHYDTLGDRKDKPKRWFMSGFTVTLQNQRRI